MPDLDHRPVIIATRGSALALAQANMIAAQCRENFPDVAFELKIIKTTGDKLQTVAMAEVGASLPKGLFTKELEVALLQREADLAVHSLKDLPTELPAGLQLTATPKRADVRDVLIYRNDATPRAAALRGLKAHTTLKDFPNGATVATSSTRRKAQLLAVRPDLKVGEIRGNVPTRLQKVATLPELDATVLALAGLTRLHYVIEADGKLRGEAVPEGLLAIVMDVAEMLPCVGQGAIGIETRTNDERINKVCAQLNHYDTYQAVTAERAFLSAMGGGCQSPVGAYAEISGETLSLQAVSFTGGTPKRSSIKGSIQDAANLGEKVAAELK